MSGEFKPPEFGPFQISEHDDTHLYIDVPSKCLSIAIKLGDDGITVDLYPAHVADESVATTWATYDEFEYVLDEDKKK